MSSRANTMRLKSLSKTMDSQYKQSVSDVIVNDSIKLPAINSVFKGVKYNDVSLMSGRQLNKLRKDPEASRDLEYQSAHENLKAMRRKFDTTKTARLEKEAKVNGLKAEVEKYKTLQDNFLQQKQGGESVTSALHGQLLSKRNQFEQAHINKNVFLNMKDYYNGDKVVYSQRIYDLQKQLKFLKKQMKVFDTEGKGFLEGQDRSKKLAEKYMQQLKVEEAHREEHIRSLETMIQEKKKVMEANSVRAVEMQEIAEQAMQDKNETEKKWEKLFLAHTFVSRMLRDKMYREMEKFNVVETAFKNIKIATGVNDSNTLVFKFLNKQTAYGQLLGKIAENESTISNLKVQAEEFYKEHKHLEDQEKQLIEMRRKQTVSLSKQVKELEAIEERKTRVNLLFAKVRNWLGKNIKKFRMMGEEVEEVKPSCTVEELKGELEKYLKTVSKNFDEVHDSMNPEEQLPVIQGEGSKINRVKVGKTRKNSVGEEISHHFEEEEKNYIHEQTDALEHDRTQLMRANEKFMKQVHQKYLEIRKAKIEAMPKEKKKEPEKKKVVEVDE